MQSIKRMERQADEFTVINCIEVAAYKIEWQKRLHRKEHFDSRAKRNFLVR